MKLRFTLAAAIISLAACTTAPTASNWISAGDAVLQAAAHPNTGVSATFHMTVQSVGESNGKVFLNSELDYRDQRNLAISMSHQVAMELMHIYGGSIDTLLQGKMILVSGDAHRVRVDFLVNDRPSGKYYYQTHVNVRQMAQIQLQPGT
jgi:hypothetical protein